MAGALLDRVDLERLTGTVQPKRMCAWLTAHGWVYLPPARRGDLPKVGRTYHDARMCGQNPDVTAAAAVPPAPRARMDFMLQP